MPNSYKDFNVGPSTTSVTFNTEEIEYLDTAHIKVVVTDTGDNSTDFLQTSNGQDNLTPPFSVEANTPSSGTTTINFNNMNGVTGNGLPANTDKIRVQRVTPSASLLTTFQNASLLRADDLNDNAKQLLFVLQEQVDAGTGSLPLNAAGFYDANGRKISNLADGTSGQDSATFGQLSALASYSTDAPTTPQFATFAGSDGTFDSSSGDTTFTIPFTPLSEIEATFICEVGGVVQAPNTDFRISGNILTIVNRDVTATGDNIAKISLQAFGVTKSVFNFPVTGEASTNTEIPITLKGAAGGDADWVLAVRKSNNDVGGAITANGTVKVRKVEPLNLGSSQGLDVNATNITTTGTINSGGTLNVGPASITQTGDATVNNLTISSGTQNANQAVPKSYVDSFGGFEGNAIAPNTSLNSILTPGLYTGTVPANKGSLVYPGNSSEGEQFALRVVRTGGTGSDHRFQEFISSSDSRITVRKYNGFNFGSWVQHAHNADTISSFAVPNANFPMNNKRIINLADNNSPQDAVTQNHLQTNYKNNTQVLDHVGTYFGLSAFNMKINFKPVENVDIEIPRLYRMQTLSIKGDPYGIASQINMVSIEGILSDPETYDNTNTGGNNDITNPFLVEIPAGLGPISLRLYIKPTSGSDFKFRLNQYTARTALSSQKTAVFTHQTANSSTAINKYVYIPDLTETRYFGVDGYVTNDNNTDDDISSSNFFIELARPNLDLREITDFTTQS